MLIDHEMWPICSAAITAIKIADFSLVDSNGNAAGAGTLGLLLSNGGTVCDDYFSSNSAEAICRELGFFGQISWTSGRKWGIQTGAITLDDVRCSSGDWSSCTFIFSHNCGHHEDVFLQCEGPGKPITLGIFDIEDHIYKLSSSEGINLGSGKSPGSVLWRNKAWGHFSICTMTLT